MTVGQLIEELKRFPDYHGIVVAYQNDFTDDILDVEQGSTIVRLRTRYAPEE